jgi:Ni,Fe-hydrogenase III component G
VYIHRKILSRAQEYLSIQIERVQHILVKINENNYNLNICYVVFLNFKSKEKFWQTFHKGKTFPTKKESS